MTPKDFEIAAIALKLYYTNSDRECIDILYNFNISGFEVVEVWKRFIYPDEKVTFGQPVYWTYDELFNIIDKYQTGHLGKNTQEQL